MDYLFTKNNKQIPGNQINFVAFAIGINFIRVPNAGSMEIYGGELLFIIIKHNFVQPFL